MKVIAPKKIKIRFYLALVLVIIFSVLSIGNRLIDKAAIDAVSFDGLQNKTIIIDAGHGGFDGGTSASDGTVEKDINLQIALKINDILNSMGIKTVMTRNDDTALNDPQLSTIRQKKVSDIKNRLNLIEQTEEPVFVSIHQNHFTQEKYSGAQVFYSKNNPQSLSLAESIRFQLITVLQPDNTREIKQSGSEIYLLHHTKAPAVMVECGFLSNYNESQLLKNEEYQRKLAFTVAVGIVDFLNQTEV